MKNFYLGIIVQFLLLTSASAQEPIAVKQHLVDKPALFIKAPERTACDQARLHKVFRASINDTVRIQFSPEYTFTGRVVEKLQKTPELLSMNLRSIDQPGALLNLSLLTCPDKGHQIRGRIIHPQSGDVLQLTAENDQYFLVKHPQKFFLAE